METIEWRRERGGERSDRREARVEKRKYEQLYYRRYNMDNWV